MSLITIEYFQKELDDSASNENGLLTKAINRATASINTWSSRKYDPFESFDVTNNTPLAPDDIIAICIEIAKAYYFLSLGEVSRAGEEKAYWKTLLNDYKKDIQEIDISPVWKDQTISLNTYDNMLIGTQTASLQFHRVIPHNAYVLSGATAIWGKETHWTITKGYVYEDEHPDGWYFRALDSDVEGTLYYMRSYRKDGKDYASYQPLD